ncbi:MAG: hypothetical protein OXC68_03715 [Aestuariivita sp.]|nr:hypothetical protein [Aestuariivita sp.]
MAEAVFDTLTVTRQLEAKGGFSSDQAAAITEAVRSGVTGGVATKTDVAELKAEFARRETRLILTIAGMMTIAVAILGILIRWPVPPV